MIRFVGLGFVIGLLAVNAHAAVVTVPGTANPWLAGMPDGSAALPADLAPANSPVLVPTVLSGGDAVVFSGGTGGVFNIPANCCDPLDGGIFQGQAFINHDFGAENGIAAIRAPVNSLLGVFLDDTQPDLLAAPTGLDFEVIGLDFVSLAPMLRQVFFIGDGYTSGSVQQAFFIPVGATRLYLGSMDGSEWANNVGAIDISVATIPIPAASWLFGSALVLVGAGWRRKARG